MTLSTSTPQLPDELIRPISEHLEGDRSSLRSLALSSRIMRQEAQRMLFRDVGILRTYREHFIFFWTICASPERLAPLVHACGLTLPPVCDSQIEWKTYSALEAMCNLKRLVINPPDRAYSPINYIKAVQMLCRCKFSLERFEWNCPSNPNTDELDTEELVREFLPQQMHLKHLSLPKYTPRALSPRGPEQHEKPFLAAICPQLVSLAGTWDMVTAFLPGHKVTAVNLQLQYHDLRRCSPSDTDVKLLEPAWQYVKALSLPCPTVRRGWWKLILQVSRFLTVMEIWAFEERWDLYALKELPALRILILSDSSSRRNEPEQDQRTIDAIFENSSRTLELIDMQISSEIFERFTRSGPGAMQKVKESEVRKWWLP